MVDEEERRFQQIEEEIRDMKSENANSHKDIYSRLNNLEKDFSSFNEKFNNIYRRLDDISIDVKSLLVKPSERYDTAIKCIITGIISVVIGMVAGGIFPT